MQEQLNGRRTLQSYLSTRLQYPPTTSHKTRCLKDGCTEGWLYRDASVLPRLSCYRGSQPYSKARRVILDGFRLDFVNGGLQRLSLLSDLGGLLLLVKFQKVFH